MMKDLFTGSLGKLNNHGGSKIYTTPNTIEVPPEYEIETNVPADYEFDRCSLDGKLWIYKRDNSLCTTVLRWNKRDQRLEFVGNKFVDNENVVSVGIDWVLTDKSIIFALDEAPYFSYTNVEHDITSVKSFYTILPPHNGWQIIENFIFKKSHEVIFYRLKYYNFTSNNFIEVPNIEYIIYFQDCFYLYCEYKIGFLFILFPEEISESNNEDDEIFATAFLDSISYELYFSNNLELIIFGEELYAFYPSEDDNNLCKKPSGARLYSLNTRRWITYYGGGAVFFDTFTNDGLILSDNAITTLPENKRIMADGLIYWVAPGAEIKAVSSDYIVASFGNNALITFIGNYLYRVLLRDVKLYLSYDFNINKRFVLAEKNGIIKVNSIFSNEKTIASQSEAQNIQFLYIILSWGAEPSDLDSHLLITKGKQIAHISYRDKQISIDGKYINLDHDDTTSYGPETITIQYDPECLYHYYVHWYTGSGTWAGSNAIVRFYINTQLKATFTVPNVSRNGYEEEWHVFEFQNGNLKVINQIRS